MIKYYTDSELEDIKIRIMNDEGISGEILEEQIKLSNEIIAEIIAEEGNT